MVPASILIVQWEDIDPWNSLPPMIEATYIYIAHVYMYGVTTFFLAQSMASLGIAKSSASWEYSFGKIGSRYMHALTRVLKFYCMPARATESQLLHYFTDSYVDECLGS